MSIYVFKFLHVHESISMQVCVYVCKYVCICVLLSKCKYLYDDDCILYTCNSFSLCPFSTRLSFIYSLLSISLLPALSLKLYNSSVCLPASLSLTHTHTHTHTHNHPLSMLYMRKYVSHSSEEIVKTIFF